MTAGLDRKTDDDAVFRGRQARVDVYAVVNAAGGIADSAALVIVTPIAIHFLGEALWGVWQLVAAVTAYTLLLNLGLNSAVSYHVSRNLASTDRERLGLSINNARTASAVTGLHRGARFIRLILMPLLSSLWL